MMKEKLASWTILILIAGIMLAFSWQKWPDMLVDYGTALYVPQQLISGKVFYRDLVNHVGPLSSYIHASLFKIFGTSLMTLALFNIALIIVLTFIIYRIFLFLTDRLVATATSATYLSIFAFSQYIRVGNYNFVCPYSYELTHGIFLSFLSMYIFLIYPPTQKTMAVKPWMNA